MPSDTGTIDLFTLPKDFYWQTEWRRVRFTDTVRVVDLARGRSAAHFIGVSLTRPGVRYIIFMDDLLDMLPWFVGYELEGEFRVVRHGRNFGIRLTSADNTPREHWIERDLIIPQYI